MHSDKTRESINTIHVTFIPNLISATSVVGIQSYLSYFTVVGNSPSSDPADTEGSNPFDGILVTH